MGVPNLGDASSEGLRSLAAPKVDQVETAAATKEGGGGGSGRVEAATKFDLYNSGPEGRNMLCEKTK